MKKRLWQIFLLCGWLFLLLFLGSGYVFNKFSNSKTTSLFTPVAWEDHLTVFDGIVSCSLTSPELAERKEQLQEFVFSKVKKKVEINKGFLYYFDDEDGMAEKIMEFISKEKACCPFFKFDLSILPFGKGLAFQVTGSQEAKTFLAEFEKGME